MALKVGINDLPEEMLIKIFINLEFGDLLEAKLVCTRWLEIISTSLKLRKARKIFLKNCLLTPNLPPISVLKRSPRQFEVLSIGDNVRVFGAQNVYEMWKGITENIKRLKLWDWDWDYPFKVTDVFGDKDVLELLFPSLQVIHFKGYLNEDSDIKSVIEEFNCVSKNISIKVDNYYNIEMLRELLHEYPTILKHIGNYGNYGNVHSPELLVNTEKLHLRSLNLKFTTVNYDNELYQKCIQKFSYVKKLRIEFDDIVPHFIPTNAIEVKFGWYSDFIPDNYKNLFNLLRTLPVSCKKILSYPSKPCMKFHELIEPKITFEMGQIKCLECFKLMSESGGVLRKIYYNYLNKDQEYIKLFRPHLKNVTELSFICVYPDAKATDSLFISMMREMKNLKKINGWKFGSDDINRSWSQMPILQTFRGTFFNKSRHALQNFASKGGGIMKMYLELIYICGSDFPFDILLCNLPRLRDLTIRATESQIDAFFKNIPKCNTRIQSIWIERPTDFSGASKRTEITTDIFSKLPTLRYIHVQYSSGVSRAEYYALLKQGKTKSEIHPFCEMCDEMTPIRVKLYWSNEGNYTQFKLVTPKDVKNELLSMEDEATVE